MSASPRKSPILVLSKGCGIQSSMLYRNIIGVAAWDFQRKDGEDSNEMCLTGIVCGSRFGSKSFSPHVSCFMWDNLGKDSFHYMLSVGLLGSCFLILTMNIFTDF